MRLSEVQQLEGAWRNAWKPPDRRSPWAWAEEHLAAIPYSPLPGRYRSDNSPWMREPLEAMVDPAAKIIQIMAAIQASKTLVMEIGSGFIIANMPGPMLWLDQTDDDAKDQNSNRLQPLYAHMEPVRSLLSKNRHKVKLDAVSYLNGMTQWLKGAHNKTNLQRRSIRWLFGDETWRWPAGHMEEAIARTTAFGWLGKCFFSSQAGEVDDDTHRQFLAGDQREWHVKCPHCDDLQPYDWKRMEWDSHRLESGARDFRKIKASVRYRCRNHDCEHAFEDTDRNRMVLSSRGKFVPMNPTAPPDLVSFHWNGLASTSWGTLVVLYLTAKDAARKGDTELIKIFYQKRLALPWNDDLEDFKMEIAASPYTFADGWEREGRIDRKGRIIPAALPPIEGAPPEDRRAEVPLRFLTVDVQMDHFWTLLRSWTETGDSRLADFRGGREGDDSVLTWEDVRAIQLANGVADRLVFVDAGFASSRVYDQCAEFGWTALMGQDRATYTHSERSADGKRTFQRERFYSPVRRVDRGNGKSARVHYYSNLNGKDILDRLRKNQNPENGTTWEICEDAPPEYLRQMDSERRMKKGNRWIWEQIGKRHNHGWDLETMQTIAACMMKLIGRESITPPEEADGEGDAEKAV
jgi:hypothetical protein